MAEPVLALAEGAHAPPNGRHVLADGEVEAFHKRGIDLPATCCHHGVDPIERAEHHPVRHVYQAPAPYGLDHLRVEPLWQWHPARLWGGARGLGAREVDPLAAMGAHGGGILLESIGEKQGDTAWGQHLHHLMDDPLGHREGAVPDIDGQQQFGDRIDRSPDPVG